MAETAGTGAAERIAAGALPAGWTVRPATMDDLGSVTALIVALDEHLLGEPEYSEDELRSGWEELDLARDTWIVFTPEGAPAGYADYSAREPHVRLMADGYVHPAHFGRGVGTALVRLTEARAREDVPLGRAGFRVALHNGVVGKDRAARDLLEREGYAAVRYFWTMAVELTEPPAAPSWPAGIAVRAVVDEADEHRVHAATDEAFQDHWGHHSVPYEVWAKRQKAEGFDPSLWFMATDGDEVAGTATCRYHGGVPYVGYLAVRRPWRRRGLARALLLHAIGEFWRRGDRKVTLGVDASNPTGATALYESVGMTVAHEFVAYEKELRPGAEWREEEDQG